MSKVRWIWRRRYHTARAYVWRPGLLGDAPAVRDLINEQLLRGLEVPVTVWGMPVLEVGDASEDPAAAAVFRERVESRTLRQKDPHGAGGGQTAGDGSQA
jgi:hypothetical protein